MSRNRFASVVSGGGLRLGRLGQGDGGFPAEGLDVEGAAAGQVEHAFAQLRRAGAGVGAADVHVPFLGRRQRGAAGGAFGGHDEVPDRRILLLAQGQDRPDDLRDDVPGLAQHHDVADLDALGLDDLLVVQGGHLHGGAGHLDGFHHAVRGDAAGAADVDRDVQQLGVDFLGRVLVGDGPARHPGGVAEGALGGEVVDLDHDAVDFVGEAVPLVAVALDEFQHVLEPGQDLEVRAGGQAPLGELAVGVRLADGVESFAGADAVHVHPQRALGGFRRVLLPQRAGGGVAGVGQRRLAGLDQRLVEFGEGLGRDEDLAPDLHLGREALAAELLRDFLDGEDVVGDVLARGAVAAGGGPDQHAVAVEQVDGEAVDLEFGEPGRRSPLPSLAMLASALAIHASSSSREKTSSRLYIRCRCSTAAKAADTSPPTSWVGESLATSSGCMASIVSSRR